MDKHQYKHCRWATVDECKHCRWATYDGFCKQFEKYVLLDMPACGYFWKAPRVQVS